MFSIKRKVIVIKLFLILCLFFSVAILSGMLITGAQAKKEPVLSENLETFRAFSIDERYIQGAARWKESEYKQLTVNYLYNKGNMGRDAVLCHRFGWYARFLPEKTVKSYEEVFRAALADGIYFPVAEDVSGGAVISYEDSWGGERTYGGERRHEGTDLMPSIVERGYFPVVSVSDGVVEKKGWLKLGGYRIGIRAPHGAYYYYAHLDHYAENIMEGSKITAGQIIGYMGDSGYGEEGTVGQFAVHLHFGVYLHCQGKEISINPYHILKSLEGKRRKVQGMGAKEA